MVHQTLVSPGENIPIFRSSENLSLMHHPHSQGMSQTKARCRTEGCDSASGDL